jgi:hypothetical protein
VGRTGKWLLNALAALHRHLVAPDSDQQPS